MECILLDVPKIFVAAIHMLDHPFGNGYLSKIVPREMLGKLDLLVCAPIRFKTVYQKLKVKYVGFQDK